MIRELVKSTLPATVADMVLLSGALSMSRVTRLTIVLESPRCRHG